MKVSNDIKVMIHGLSNTAHKSPNIDRGIQADRSETDEEKNMTPVVSAKISWQDIYPNVVHHSTEEDHPDVDPTIDTSKMRLLRYNNYSESDNERNIRLAKRNQEAAKIKDLQKEMEPFYANFMREVSDLYPNIAEKEFGISVDEKGKLIIVDNEKKLSEREEGKLSNLLDDFNSNLSFTTLANEYVESVVNWVELDRRKDGTGFNFGSIGNYDVTKDNFHEVIDLASILENINDPFFYFSENSFQKQIVNNAEKTNNKHDIDQLVNGKWVDVEI